MLSNFPLSIFHGCDINCYSIASFAAFSSQQYPRASEEHVWVRTLHSGLYICSVWTLQSQTNSYKIKSRKNLSMVPLLYMGLPFPAEPQKTAPFSSKPLKLPHRTHNTNIFIPSTAKGNNKPCFFISCYNATTLVLCWCFLHYHQKTILKKMKLSSGGNRLLKTKKLNSEVSPSHYI